MTEENSGAQATEASTETSAEQQNTSIRRLTLAVLGLCVFMLVWYLIADRYTPYTDQARVTGHIIPIVPKVSGEVISVDVGVNALVKQGDTLLQIDPSDYEIAVASAEAALQQEAQNVGAGAEGVAVAQAELSQAITQEKYVIAQSKRVCELEKDGVLPVSDGDKARAEVKKARADVEAAEAKLERAQQRLGETDENNPKFRQAASKLDDARLDLERTTIIAPSDGGVTSVNIATGNYASAGQALMTFVSAEDVWVEAYMRENSLGNIRPGNPVEIALDMRPGKVYHGEVVSIGYAVDWKNHSQAGSLQSVSSDTGWLRSAQRFPVIIRFNERPEPGIVRGGGQADVTIYTSGNWITNSLAWIWMRIVSIFSYAY